MNKKTITLEQARKRIQFFNQFEVYKPITLIKKIVGYSMIAIGTITLPLPTGSVFLIILGCAVLAIDHKKLLKAINFYGKEIFYWAIRQARSLKWWTILLNNAGQTKQGDYYQKGTQKRWLNLLGVNNNGNNCRKIKTNT